MKKISSDIIIIGILWISIIVSLYFNSIFNYPFIFGIIGLSIVTITYKKFHEFSFGIFALILFLSIFNVITFSNAFGVNFGIFSVTSIILFAILFFTQIGNFLELKRKWFEDDDEESEVEKNRKIKNFKKQFQNLSESELKRKVEDDKLIEEAKIAISELLDEKSQTSHSTNSL